MPAHYQERIEKLLLELENGPVPAKTYDIEKMEGIEDTYRIRVGDIRIQYTVLWKTKEIDVLKISWRGRAYK